MCSGVWKPRHPPTLNPHRRFYAGHLSAATLDECGRKSSAAPGKQNPRVHWRCIIEKRLAPKRCAGLQEVRCFIGELEWCPGAESNHRHRDFQSRALPTELPGRRPRNEGSHGAGRYKGLVEACPATQIGRGDMPATRSVGSLVAWIDIIRASLIRLVIVLLRGRDRVSAPQPAVQVDVGAAARAERPKLLDARLAADRARLRGVSARVQ